MRSEGLRLRADPGWAFAEAFERRSACMADLLMRCLPAWDTGPIQELELLQGPAGEPQVVGALARLSRPFAGERWAASEDRVQRMMALDYAAEGLGAAALAFGWSMQAVVLARQRAISRGYINEQRWRKPSPGPDRRQAQLLWRFEPEQIALSVELSDRRGRVLGQIPLLTLPPDLQALTPLLGRLRWRSPEELVLECREPGQELRVPLAALRSLG